MRSFPLAIYGRLGRQPGNICFSPHSIRSVLAMAAMGAHGDTATQMRKVLHLPCCGEAVTGPESPPRETELGPGQCELVSGDSLWVQEGLSLLPQFLKAVRSRPGAAANSLDFRRDSESARRTINQWVEGRTHNRIQDLIPEGRLTTLDRLVLVNALYFRGAWALPFRKAATHAAPFHLPGGETVQVRMMLRQFEQLRYAQCGGLQGVELDYSGCDLSMLLLLPDQRDGLGDLEAALSTQLIDDLMTRMVPREVRVLLPRFRITWGSVDISRQLADIGMPLPFVMEAADFSGINGHRPPSRDALHVSAVWHKAFLEVDEQGTEAAAATAATMGTTAMPTMAQVPVFRADHPFIFAVRERRSGTLLFLGRLADPSAAGGGSGPIGDMAA